MNPEIGRFVSRDPWDGIPEFPITLHKYLYASANPVMYVDPSGLRFGLVQLATTTAIISSLASMVIPSHENNVATGYVTDFSLKFENGKTLGYIIYGGSIYAKITSYNFKGVRLMRTGTFLVSMIGLGKGFGYTEYSDITRFHTNERTRVEDFEGWGRTTAIELTVLAGPLNTNLSAITLPNGKTIGPDENSYSKAYGWAVSAYVVLTYWDLQGTPKTTKF